MNINSVVLTSCCFAQCHFFWACFIQGWCHFLLANQICSTFLNWLRMQARCAAFVFKDWQQTSLFFQSHFLFWDQLSHKQPKLSHKLFSFILQDQSVGAKATLFRKLYNFTSLGTGCTTLLKCLAAEKL